MSRKVLIIGATSTIAHETAKLFARDGDELLLIGRTHEKLASVRNDLLVRGSRRVETFLLDVTHLTRHQELVDTAISTLGGIDVVLLAHGTLRDQETVNGSVSDALKEFDTNCISVISLLTIIGNHCERQKRGRIAVLTSVAGDRGRKSNYVYGSAKGAVSIFLQGLRNRLHKASVSVVTIKVGPVDTPMTNGMKKHPLFTRPSNVGRSIYTAIEKGKDVVYIPWVWRPIMAVLKGIPEPIFKRLDL